MSFVNTSILLSESSEKSLHSYTSATNINSSKKNIFVFGLRDNNEMERFGVLIADLLAFIRWSIKFKQNHHSSAYDGSKYHFDGHYWMQDSIEKFMGLIGKSRSTVLRYLKRLEEEDYLIVHRTGTTWGRSSNFYRINPAMDISAESKPPEIDRKPTEISKVSKCDFASSMTKNQNNISNHTTLSKSYSCVETPPIEGDDERLEAIPYFEEKIGGKVTINDRKKFIAHLQQHPQITATQLFKNIDYLADDPLRKISTTSINRLFYVDDIRRIYEQGMIEIKKITLKHHIGFSNTFQSMEWQKSICRSSFAKKHKLAPFKWIVNYCANVVGLNVSYTPGIEGVA